MVEAAVADLSSDDQWLLVALGYRAACGRGERNDFVGHAKIREDFGRELLREAEFSRVTEGGKNKLLDLMRNKGLFNVEEDEGTLETRLASDVTNYAELVEAGRKPGGFL